MSVEQARKLLPAGSIIGLSCNTVAHVKEAVRARVDYIGIGAVWGTQTKKLTEPIIGVRGVGAMLEELAGTDIKAVAIGAFTKYLSCGAHKLFTCTFARRHQIHKSFANAAWHNVYIKSGTRRCCHYL
jgi:hypothetical protein